MQLPKNLIRACILRRLNRFAVAVELSDGQAIAHLPNSGRLHELLKPGTPCWLVPKLDPNRKTRYDLLLVRLGRTLVSADARLPSRLVLEALKERKLPQFSEYTDFQTEVRWNHSRIDLLLTGSDRPCLLEAKSVTLVLDATGLFPDAPTTRGQRHVADLIAALDKGYRAAIVFVVQRNDASRFRPNDASDPAFGQILRRAARQGVEIYAYTCNVTLRSITISRPIPVEL